MQSRWLGPRKPQLEATHLYKGLSCFIHVVVFCAQILTDLDESYVVISVTHRLCASAFVFCACGRLFQRCKVVVKEGPRKLGISPKCAMIADTSAFYLLDSPPISF